jgi:hypothetical protein
MPFGVIIALARWPRAYRVRMALDAVYTQAPDAPAMPLFSTAQRVDRWFIAEAAPSRPSATRIRRM